MDTKMKTCAARALILASLWWTAPALAQQASITQTIAGTRLDLNAIGEVTRVPDVAVITAGVVTRSSTASGALGDVAGKIARVLLRLKQSGVADRDIETSNVSLSPEYRYVDNQPPQLTGYSASNQLKIKFRDIRNSGKIIDALVGEGANQIDGPQLLVDKPQEALDEARTKAIALGRARAELYAKSLGLHVARVVSVAESGGYSPAPPAPMAMMARMENASTKIEPGEQRLEVNLAMTFELQ